VFAKLVSKLQIEVKHTSRKDTTMQVWRAQDKEARVRRLPCVFIGTEQLQDQHFCHLRRDLDGIFQSGDGIHVVDASALAGVGEGRMSSKDSSERHLGNIFRGLTPVNYPSSVMPK